MCRPIGKSRRRRPLRRRGCTVSLWAERQDAEVSAEAAVASDEEPLLQRRLMPALQALQPRPKTPRLPAEVDEAVEAAEAVAVGARQDCSPASTASV